jgi:hypothetical protein
MRTERVRKLANRDSADNLGLLTAGTEAAEGGYLVLPGMSARRAAALAG